MNRVLVFGITDLPGGVESVIMNYYRNIDKSNIQFDFLCNTETVAYEDEIKKLGGTIYRVTARSKNYKKYKEDMKYFFSTHAKEYNTIWVNVCSLANIDYLKYAKKYGISRRIIHCHNSQNMDSKIRGILHKINKIIIGKYATDYWSCSDDSSPWFYDKRILKSPNYRVVYNAIKVDNFLYNKDVRTEYRKNLNLMDKFVVGNVGRFHFQKNHFFMLNVFNDILKEKDNAVLILVGDGPDFENIKKYAQTLGISEKILFLGKRTDVNNLLQCMDVFLFPSLFEGLPVTLVEAQVAGIPVFASDCIKNDELVIDENIMNFLSLDASAEFWAKEILKHFNKKVKRCSNIEKIRNSRYNIDVEVKKIEKIFLTGEEKSDL